MGTQYAKINLYQTHSQKFNYNMQTLLTSLFYTIFLQKYFGNGALLVVAKESQQFQTQGNITIFPII